MKNASLFLMLLIVPALIVNSSAQTVRYKCPKCGRYHVRAATTQPERQTLKPSVPAPAAAQTATESGELKSAGAQATPASVQPASATDSSEAATKVQAATATSPRKRWRFHNANRWARRINPSAQAWAQVEADRLAKRGYQGYLQNGHPGGNNPHARVTGTGTTFPGADLIHTCEGDTGMTLVAEAAAVSWDGRIYGVRSWR